MLTRCDISNDASQGAGLPLALPESGPLRLLAPRTFFYRQNVPLNLLGDNSPIKTCLCAPELTLRLPSVFFAILDLDKLLDYIKISFPEVGNEASLDYGPVLDRTWIASFWSTPQLREFPPIVLPPKLTSLCLFPTDTNKLVCPDRVSFFLSGSTSARFVDALRTLGAHFADLVLFSNPTRQIPSSSLPSAPNFLLFLSRLVAEDWLALDGDDRETMLLDLCRLLGPIMTISSHHLDMIRELPLFQEHIDESLSSLAAERIFQRGRSIKPRNAGEAELKEQMLRDGSSPSSMI